MRYMIKENDLISLYKKYDLSYEARIVTGHLAFYINTFEGDEKAVLLEEIIKDEEGYKTVLDKCIAYYKIHYSTSKTVLDALLHDNYMSVLEGYRFMEFDSVAGVCKCLSEYFKNINI